MNKDSTKCDGCGYNVTFNTLAGIEGTNLFGQHVTFQFCQLCSNTYAEDLVGGVPYLDPDLVRTLKTVCYVGNAILGALKK